MIKLLSLFSIMAVLLYSAYLVLNNDTLQESIKRGETIYSYNCASCHMGAGEGIDGAFPPLAKSDFLMEDRERSILVLLKGLNEKITVNGKVYSIPMAAQDYLSDKQISDVLNFVRNSWGNKGEIILPEAVTALRNKETIK
jgi:mono/diheme cytochrome c family protein